MFEQFEYFTNILPDIPEIKDIKRVTGLSGMEEALESIRTIRPPVLLVEDAGNGFLTLSDKVLDHGYHTFSVVDQAKLNDSNSRLAVQERCKRIGYKIFFRMLTDSREYGSPCYGIDRSRIDYQRIGPLVKNYYGYMFSYILDDENFSLNG